jgi:hypothetical protein
MDPEFERIRGYLQTQASKLSVPELADKVRADMEQLRSAAESVPPGRFLERPGESDWSANEVMAHVVDGGKAVARSITGVLDSGHKPGPAFVDRMEKTETERSAEGWWSALLTDREALFGRVKQATGDEYLDVTWTHPMFGDLNWREWLLFLRIHDLDHARQIQAISATTA